MSAQDKTAAYIVLRTQVDQVDFSLGVPPEEIYCPECSPEGVPDGVVVIVLSGRKLDKLREGWVQGLFCSSCGAYL